MHNVERCTYAKLTCLFRDFKLDVQHKSQNGDTLRYCDMISHYSQCNNLTLFQLWISAHIFFDDAMTGHGYNEFIYECNDFVKMLVSVVDTAAR